MSKQLTEAIAEAPVKKGNRWRVIVARPGKGSSGTYSEELFRRDAEKIIAPGGQMFINHDASRNPKDMVAIYPEGSYWDEDEKAVVAEAEVFSHWKDFVEEVGPHCGASLYCMGESDEEGNVTAILEDRLNGADLVARPGLVGSGLAEKLYESAIAGSDVEPTVTLAEENGVKMDQEMKDAFAAINARFDTLSAEKTAAEATAAKVEADAEAVAKAVEAYASAERAVEAADLFKSQKESILAEAKKGVDVAPLIEAAKAVAVEAKAEAEAHVSESASVGRVITESVETSYGAFA